MTGEHEITLYQASLPAQVSKTIEAEFNQQMERLVATGEIGMVGMGAMSEVARHAAFKVATTASAADLLAKGAAATRPNSAVTPAEQEVQQRLFGDYTHHVAQLAEMTNIKILQTVDRATDQLSKRTLTDVLEGIDARLTDAIAGRPNRLSLPNGRR
jgi:hypothetical protein